MNADDSERIAYAVSHTEVLRSPRQTLATFGNTNIRYFLLTKPSYDELVQGSEDTVIREGRVVSESPRVVTPGYLTNLEGFGESASRYLRWLIRESGANTPGLLYHYRNEPKDLTIVSGSILSAMERVEKEIEGDPMAAIIQGVDDMWDVSLLKFINDLTTRSLEGNLTELESRGLIRVDASGIPGDARRKIEEMFRYVKMKKEDPARLKQELDRWGIFHEYEDRFLRLFR